MVKKSLMAVVVLFLTIGMLAACSSGGSNSASESSNSGSSGNSSSSNQGSSSSNADSSSSSDSSSSMKHIDSLKISFVPSRKPQKIITVTEPLKQLLKDQLAKEGYDVGEVKITVGTSYQAVGEALVAGTTDIGFIPGGTYVLYDDGAEVILTATRFGLSNDYTDPAKWNSHEPTKNTKKQVSYYRSLFIAGPSEKGQALAKKVNSGKKLTWEDLNSASWAVKNISSSASYIYPTIYLKKHYNGKTLTDLDNISVSSTSYAGLFAKLAQKQVDVITIYADARMDYNKSWKTDFGRKNTIWEDTDVIAVTQPIYNDTISVSKNSEVMTEDLKKALQKAFIQIAHTEKGQKVIAIYSHQGYVKAQPSDYDGARKAQKIIKSMQE